MCLWSECPQQEYIAIDTKVIRRNAIQDSDHQPRYEDILAERMKSSETPGGLALNQAGAAGLARQRCRAPMTRAGREAGAMSPGADMRLIPRGGMGNAVAGG